MGGTLTAEFPGEPEPERQPEVKAEFENASVSEAQERAERQRIRQLESERSLKAELHHTPGGTIEQASHESADEERQKEIAKLREKMACRDRGRGRAK